MSRFSLRTFLVVVAFLAFGCAGIIYSNTLWRHITATVVLALLLWAVLMVAALRRPTRWFWFGLAVTGWTYLGLVFYTNQVKHVLLTHDALQWFQEVSGIGDKRRLPDGRYLIEYGDAMRFYPGRPIEKVTHEKAARRGWLQYLYDPSTSPRSDYFYDIGHLLWALLLGSVAGVLTSRVRKSETSPTEGPPK